MEGESQIKNPETEESVDEFHAHFPGASVAGKDTLEARLAFEKRYGIGGYFFPGSALPVIAEHRRIRFELPNARANYNASKIIELSGNKHIIISGSSAGVKDIIEAVNVMLKKGIHDRDITIMIMNSPGLAEIGFSGVKRLAVDMGRMFTTMDLIEQHITYPGPEKLYENPSQAPKVRRKSVETFEDTPQDRDERRVEFIQNLDRLIPDLDKRRDFVAQLNVIDAQIELACDAGDNNKKDELLVKRSKLLHDYKEKYFHGELVDEENRDRLLKEYGEVKRNLLVRFGMLSQTFLYAMQLIKDVYVGYENGLSDIVYRARKNKVQIKIGIAVMEHDKIVPPQDLQNIADNFQEVALDLAWLGYFQNMGHVTVGQYPELILKAVGAMRRNLTSTDQ